MLIYLLIDIFIVNTSSYLKQLVATGYKLDPYEKMATHNYFNSIIL